MTRNTFAGLVLESEQTLYRVSMSILKNETDCEDAVQTAILAAYEKLNTLKNEEFFKTWLVRILINICYQQLRAKSRVVSLQEYTDAPSVSHDREIDVKLALEQLPLKIREVIVLYYMEDFSVREVSQILRIPEGTVKSRLSKGRQMLRITCE